MSRLEEYRRWYTQYSELTADEINRLLNIAEAARDFIANPEGVENFDDLETALEELEEQS